MEQTPTRTNLETLFTLFKNDKMEVKNHSHMLPPCNRTLPIPLHVGTDLCLRHTPQFRSLLPLTMTATTPLCNAGKVQIQFVQSAHIWRLCTVSLPNPNTRLWGAERLKVWFLVLPLLPSLSQVDLVSSPSAR